VAACTPKAPPTQPITFTGPEATPGSWAGIVLNGRSICNDATATTSCRFEAVPELVRPGAAGAGRQLGCAALRAHPLGRPADRAERGAELADPECGRLGTVLEHVQVDGGLDDGFELFGGSVNGKYLVCSNMGDDCFDFDQGYSGKIQFALGVAGHQPRPGRRQQRCRVGQRQSRLRQAAAHPADGVEPDPGGIRHDVGNEGMRIRRGSGGNYSNVLVTGFRDRCINLVDAQTYALSSATQTGNSLTMTHSWVGSCQRPVRGRRLAAYARQRLVQRRHRQRHGRPAAGHGRLPADRPRRC
jgi:hypothetical protein